MKTHRCIWCTKDKPESDFNTEHVMPRSFGTFEGNLTLVNTVCTACNSFFSRELEPSLARDMPEGFDRYVYGLKATSAFKSLGKKSTTRVQMPGGEYAGAWGYAVAGEEMLGIRLFPQIGFARSAAGPFIYFPVDELPTKDQLLAQGFKEQVHLRLCECSQELAGPRLKERGFPVDWTDTFPPPNGPTEVEQVFKLTSLHRRGIAKIALNYIASQYGATIALASRFDPIRRFVMEGAVPEFPYYSIDAEPIVDGDKRDGKRLLGHILAVRHAEGGDGAGVEATVSLFNRFRHGICLSVAPGSRLEPRGHFFDTANRMLYPMSPASKQ